MFPFNWSILLKVSPLAIFLLIAFVTLKAKGSRVKVSFVLMGLTSTLSFMVSNEVIGGLAVTAIVSFLAWGYFMGEGLLTQHPIVGHGLLVSFFAVFISAVIPQAGMLIVLAALGGWGVSYAVSRMIHP